MAKKTPFEHYQALKDYLKVDRFVLDVANYLNVTQAQAGRILNQLEVSGYATKTTVMSYSQGMRKIRKFKAVQEKTNYNLTLTREWK